MGGCFIFITKLTQKGNENSFLSILPFPPFFIFLSLPPVQKQNKTKTPFLRIIPWGLVGLAQRCGGCNLYMGILEIPLPNFFC